MGAQLGMGTGEGVSCCSPPASGMGSGSVAPGIFTAGKNAPELCAGSVLGAGPAVNPQPVSGAAVPSFWECILCVWLGENSGEMRTTEIVLLGRWWGLIK